MKITILDMPNKPIETLYKAFKTCVSKCTPTEVKIPIVETSIGNIPDKNKMTDLIKRHINHESVLEHTNITFSIEGVSRSLSHQLVRHRLASYSQQSQRYVKFGQFEYVIPPEIEKIPLAKKIFIETMENDQKCYDELVQLLMNNERTEKEAIEDARYVFPNACCTNLVWTCNLRELRHFYAERDCKFAQWEIRKMAELAISEVEKYIPFIKYKAKKCGVTCFECQNKEGDK